MATQPTTKQTKDEILKMYEELLQEKQQLEAKLTHALQAKPTGDQGGAAPIIVQPAAEAIPTTLDGIMATLTALRPAFGNAVSDLSAQLVAEASTLTELHQQVAQERQSLEALHGLHVTETTLTQLLQEYTDKAAAFDAERTQQRETFAHAMAEQRNAWRKAQEEQARAIKKRDETMQKTEQREAAEYQYDLEYQRNQDNDRYALQRAQLEKALKEAEALKQREWAEREKHLADQEAELAALQMRVEKFPKELEMAVKKAREEAAATARRQTKVKTDLRAKETEGARRVYDLKIQAFERTLKKQEEQLTTLSAQLDAAGKQSQALALKAIEGASSSGSLQAVKEIALEQARTVQKGK